MSIRAVCIVLAFVVPGPLRWVFIAGAVVLPYVAVVIANAGQVCVRAVRSPVPLPTTDAPYVASRIDVRQEAAEPLVGARS